MTATAELLGCAGDGQRAPKAQVPPAAFLGRRREGGGRWLEPGMKRVKQCLGALFSFSSIPKQQISPGLRQEISIPAQQCDLVLDFPAAPGAARGDPRGLPDTGGGFPASLPALGTGNALAWVTQGPLLACHIPGFLQKREIIFKRAVQCVRAGFFYLVGWVFNNSYELSGGCWVTACPGSCVTVRHWLVTGTSGCPQPSGHG